MFKKWFASVLCVLVLMMPFASISVFAGPDDTVRYSLSVTEGKAGDTVTVSVSISENSRLTNTMMYLHYNPEAVSYVADSIAAGAASPKSGTMFDALAHTDKYYVKAAYITGNVVTKGGVLITFDFEVLSDVPAAFSLSFDECQGEAEDGTMFDIRHEVVGCVLNNDGNVANPTGEPVYTTTTITPATSTTVSDPISDPQTQPAATTTMPTMIVTDEGNNEIEIPVVTQTDAAGNVATIPVAVVTNAQGTTVTVPVVIVTDAQGSVATIPVSEGTDANGNNVTIPVAIVTDADGNIETVPVATSTDANGNIVTVPLTTVVGDLEGVEVPDEGGSPWLVIIMIAVGVAVAIGIAIAATNARKKNDDQ